MSFTKDESEQVRLLLMSRSEYEPPPSKETIDQTMVAVLHLVHVLNETFYEHVVKDALIVHNPDVFHQALSVHAELSDLYQAVGNLSKDPAEPEVNPRLEKYLDRLDSEE